MRLPRRLGVAIVILPVLLVMTAARSLFAALRLIEPDLAGLSRSSPWVVIGVAPLLRSVGHDPLPALPMP